MMTAWARIENERVQELTDVNPDGRFHPSIVWVECPAEVEQEWTYIGGVFAPYVPPGPTPEELLATQSAILQNANHLASAQKNALTNRIGTIQDAIDFEEATPEEFAELPERQSQLVLWKKYAIALGRVTSQPGWFETVDWPEQPSEGMDLTVSAKA